MNARWPRAAAVAMAWIWGAALPAEYIFAPRTHDDMEARLTATVAPTAAERGFAEVTLNLTVEGPAALEVEKPRLGDAAAAWKDERGPIRREERGGRASWSQVVRLKQVKPGFEPVADLTVRFRREPDADWIEEKWIDIFREFRVPSESAPPEPKGQPSWLGQGEAASLLSALAALLLWVWWKRRRARRDLPLPPESWALREIDRLERTLVSPNRDVDWYHTQLSYIVRRYWSERFGGHALQQTTAEFLDEVRQTSPLTADRQERLHEWFDRCDLAKYARAGASPDECRRTAELARELVRRTTPTGS